MNHKLIFIFLTLATISAVANANKKIVCYYGSWAAYRTGNGRVKANNLNPNLCTHMIYSFIGATDQGVVKILDPYNDVTNGGFTSFIGLKVRNPKVKLLVAMGGWSEGSIKYSNIMKSDVLRTKLVTSILAFTQQWKFDGIDIDWEYPAQRGGAPEDRQNFIKFLKELRERSSLGFIISAAVGAADNLIATSYDVRNMNLYLDFINLMTYDYSGSWSSVTGHNAPLQPVMRTVTNWITNGATANKLILGVPIYGITWTLSNAAVHNVGSLASGPGKPGKYTNQAGQLTYLEVCESFYTSNWSKFWSSTQSVPSAVHNDQWLSYDDVKSVQLKAQYAIGKNLGGVMVWAIDGDDVYGVCGPSFPILNALNRVILI